MATPALILMQPPEPAAAPGRTLRELEETLQALRECEGAVPPELQEEYYEEIRRTLVASRAKCDSYQRWLISLEREIAAGAGEVGALKAEIARIQSRNASLESRLEDGKNYVLRVVQSLGEPDPQGRYVQKLEGTTVLFAAQKNPSSLSDRIDPDVLPGKYKAYGLSVPAPLWEEILDSLDLDLRERLLDSIRPKLEIDRAAVKADLKDGEVPGAAMNPPSYRLVRK